MLDPALAGKKLLSQIGTIGFDDAGVLVYDGYRVSLAEEFYDALNALLNSIDLLPTEFNLLTAENPTQLLAAFKAFAVVVNRIDKTSSATVAGLTDLSEAEIQSPSRAS